MPNKTVYVREEDVPVWDNAAALAGEGNLSSYVTESLRQRMAEPSEPEEFERIEVGFLTFTDYGDLHKRKAFQGRWLIHIEEPTDQEWGIALTKRGNFVFYSYPEDIWAVEDNLEAFRDRVDPAAYEIALSNLTPVEELDI